jgi:predicted XRE-type DNA-binding protein
VWDAIEDTPQQAASMRARSELMMNLTEVIRERGMTQGDAAALFGVTQPRVSDLMRGKINLFSLDTLIDMAATAGMCPTVKVTKPKTAKQARVKRGAAPEMVAA